MRQDWGYLIFTPNYVEHSNGIRSLFELGRALGEKGFRVYFTNDTAVSLFKTPQNYPGLVFIDFHSARYILRFGKFVAVYPEIVFGNPLGASRVVRYILAPVGSNAGPTTFSDNDLKFVYSNNFYSKPFSGKLKPPFIDTEIFYPGKIPQERDLSLIYFGKVKLVEANTEVELPEKFKNFTLIGRTTPQKKFLGDMFRKAKILVSYDTLTALAYEAAYCGCPVVLLSNDQELAQKLKQDEMKGYGICVGLENLWQAEETLPLLFNEYEKLEKEWIRDVENFIDVTQSFVEGKLPDEYLQAALIDSLSFENYLLKGTLNKLLYDLDPKSIKLRVIVWGTGRGADYGLSWLTPLFEILAIVSSSRETNQIVLRGKLYKLLQPSELEGLEYSLLIVASQFSSDIVKFIEENCVIESDRVRVLNDFFLTNERVAERKNPYS
jgi:hypothetical protein